MIEAAEVVKQWSAEDWEDAIQEGIESGRLGIHRYSIPISATRKSWCYAFFVQRTTEEVWRDDRG